MRPPTRLPSWPNKLFWGLDPLWRFREFEAGACGRYVDYVADEIAKPFIEAAYDDEEREYRVEDVRDLADRLRKAAADLDVLVGRHRRERRIAALENTTGRTSEEAALYRAKADQLRARADR